MMTCNGRMPNLREAVAAAQRNFGILIYHVVRTSDWAALNDLANALLYVARRIGERRAAARAVVEQAEVENLTPAMFETPRKGGELIW
ncbi:MAG TPA: hypothetical protein VMW93_07910 [bacterium]|nr:hypothetical protein [bacterium]